MADQLNPDEKFHLITRNLQVGQTDRLRQTDSSSPDRCSVAFVYILFFTGGSWRGEAQADPPGEGVKVVLGHRHHRQTSRGLLCPDVQDSRLPQGWM